MVSAAPKVGHAFVVSFPGLARLAIDDETWIDAFKESVVAGSGGPVFRTVEDETFELRFGACVVDFDSAVYMASAYMTTRDDEGRLVADEDAISVVHVCASRNPPPDCGEEPDCDG